MRRIAFFLYSFPAFGMLYLLTIPAILFALLMAYSGSKRWMEKAMRWWARSVFTILLSPIRVKGMEKLDPTRKYLLVANHASAFDIPAIMSFYPGVSWFGREHLLRIPLFGHLLKVSDYVPMKKSGIRETRMMLHKLISKSNGRTIAIFPEGTRTLDGCLGRFHKGFVHVIRSSDLDILPVTLNGFYKLKPKNRFYIDFGASLEAVIHPSISSEQLQTMSDEAILAEVRQTLESAYTIRSTGQMNFIQTKTT